MNGRRNDFLDGVKAFAILSVVFGHCIQYGSGDAFFSQAAFFDHPVFKFIYSWHMPLFMLVSGALFACTAREKTLREIALSRIRTLLVPILAWSVIPLVTAPDTAHSIRACLTTVFTNLWFLWAILWCSLAVTALRRWFRDSLWAYALLFILMFFTSDDMNAHLYKFMYPYFVAGYLFMREGCAEKLRHVYTNPAVIAATGVLFAGLFALYSREAYIYTTGISILHSSASRQLGIDLYRFCIGFAGCAFLLMLFYGIAQRVRFPDRIKKAWLAVGRSTMGVYVISEQIFAYVLRRWTAGVPGVHLLITSAETALILAFSLGCTHLIRKSTLASRVLLGGRG